MCPNEKPVSVARRIEQACSYSNTHDLGVEPGQAGLAVVVEDEHGVDHFDDY